MSSPARPLSSRPVDAVYAAWFVVHLGIMFCVDLVPIYSSFGIAPSALLQLRAWYIDAYKDRFFVDAPAWFTSFMWMELLYHVPLSVWAVGALVRDDPLVSLHLLIWSLQTALTTLVCVVEFNAWPGITQKEWLSLAGLYVPYLVLAVAMGADMFLRVRERLLSSAGTGRPKRD